MDKRKILIVLNSILVIVLGWFIVQTVPMQDKLRKAAAQNTTANGDYLPETPSFSQSHSRTDYNEIVARERNLFAATNSSADIKAPVGLDQNISSEQPTVWELNDGELVLRGTIAGPSEIARAIIRDLSTNESGLYKIGDQIAGAEIVNIEKNAIILACNGQKKILKLNYHPQKSQPRQKGRNKKEHARPVVAAKKIKSKTQIRNEILENFLKSAQIKPYVVKSQTQGLRITGLDKIEAAKFIGLKNGDIIQVVNGQKLTSIQKAFQVFKKAKTQPYLHIEYLRNDKTETLSFP